VRSTHIRGSQQIRLTIQKVFSQTDELQCLISAPPLFNPPEAKTAIFTAKVCFAQSEIQGVANPVTDVYSKVTIAL
jgi:hypothetical protein